MEKKEFTKLRDNALDGFRNGACLDLRVRLAMEILAHSSWIGEAANPAAAALVALEASTELFALAEQRGLIEPFPEDGELGRYLKNHCKRQVAWQLEQQAEARRQQGVPQIAPASAAVRDALKPN